MTELARRRRALMGAQGGVSVIPGRTVTLTTSFTTGTDCETIMNQLIADNNINCPAIIVTSKKLSELKHKEFVMAAINYSGSITYPRRYLNGGLDGGGTNWRIFEFIGITGTQFYVIESDATFNNSSEVPGKSLQTSAQITNGGNMKTTVEADLASAGITNMCAIFTAKEKSTWPTKEFVTAYINGGGTVNSGFRKESATSIAGKPVTSTYDFTCTAGTEFYVVEVLP